MNQSSIQARPANAFQMEIGRIAASKDQVFWVDLDRGRIRARKSFGCLVDPQPRDQVLVTLTTSGPHYILQVLERDTDLPVQITFDRQTRFSNPDNALALNADQVRFQGRRIRMDADRLTLLGRRFELGFENTVFRVKKWLAHVDRQYEKLVDSHRWVQNLDRRVVGRFVGLARSTLFWKSKNTRIIAEEKAVVDGEKIQIG